MPSVSSIRGRAGVFTSKIFIMKKFSLCLLGCTAALFTTPAFSQMIVPTDVKPTCVVDAGEFDSWHSGENILESEFEMSQILNNKSGIEELERYIEEQGPNFIWPANSVRFAGYNQQNGAGVTTCDFYKWGAQMFLWLTSQEAGEENGLVLDRTSMLTVSPTKSNGTRDLIRYIKGEMQDFKHRTEKSNEDIGEFGQAGGGGVLLSQQGSLVYYGIHVNNFYGAFLTGQKLGAFGMTDFPHNMDGALRVKDYADSEKNQLRLTGPLLPQTLAMELKTSWVLAESIPAAKRADYVLMEAKVPTFDKAPALWKNEGDETKIVLLALTGMHVVGTVNGHPEFVWATFEHISNTPDADYWYINKDNTPKVQTFRSNSDFLFMAKGGEQNPSNLECATGHGSSIKATTNCGDIIAPSNTVRLNPWGSNVFDDNAIENNTFLLSINNSVNSKLPTSDPRRNYVQVGSIWTAGAKGKDAPVPFYGGSKKQQADLLKELRGSLVLANSTMETYHQNINCFVCHSVSEKHKDTFGLSHIYSEIQGLNTK